MDSGCRRTARISNLDTVTSRALSSTSAPSRARSYARRPPTLIADTVLGTCEIRPVRALDALATICSGVTAARVAASALAVSTPSASSVSVADAEPDRGLVGLVEADDEGEQPRRALDAEDQQARRHRVERAGMADLARAERAPGAGDHVVAGHAARLVDEQDSRGDHQRAPRDDAVRVREVGVVDDDGCRVPRVRLVQVDLLALPR